MINELVKNFIKKCSEERHISFKEAINYLEISVLRVFFMHGPNSNCLIMLLVDYCIVLGRLRIPSPVSLIVYARIRYYNKVTLS